MKFQVSCKCLLKQNSFFQPFQLDSIRLEKQSCTVYFSEKFFFKLWIYGPLENNYFLTLLVTQVICLTIKYVYATCSTQRLTLQELSCLWLFHSLQPVLLTSSSNSSHLLRMEAQNGGGRTKQRIFSPSQKGKLVETLRSCISVQEIACKYPVCPLTPPRRNTPA